jgi:hypothetical protein
MGTQLNWLRFGSCFYGSNENAGPTKHENCSFNRQAKIANSPFQLFRITFSTCWPAFSGGNETQTQCEVF